MSNAMSCDSPTSLQRHNPQWPSRHMQRHPCGVRLRGLLRVQRLPVTLLGAGGLQLHPQHHLSLPLLHHQQRRQGESRGGRPVFSLTSLFSMLKSSLSPPTSSPLPGQSATGLPQGSSPRHDRDPDSQGVPLRHVPQVPLLTCPPTECSCGNKSKRQRDRQGGAKWGHGSFSYASATFLLISIATCFKENLLTHISETSQSCIQRVSVMNGVPLFVSLGWTESCDCESLMLVLLLSVQFIQPFCSVWTYQCIEFVKQAVSSSCSSPFRSAVFVCMSVCWFQNLRKMWCWLGDIFWNGHIIQWWKNYNRNHAFKANGCAFLTKTLLKKKNKNWHNFSKTLILCVNTDITLAFSDWLKLIRHYITFHSDIFGFYRTDIIGKPHAGHQGCHSLQ